VNLDQLIAAILGFLGGLFIALILIVAFELIRHGIHNDR
jgi:hypothetical protein